MQNAMAPYQEILTNTPEVQFAMTIAGAPSSNQSLNVVTFKRLERNAQKAKQLS